jgi:hypothetical protein
MSDIIGELSWGDLRNFMSKRVEERVYRSWAIRERANMDQIEHKKENRFTHKIVQILIDSGLMLRR